MPTGVIVMFVGIGFGILILMVFGRGKKGK